MKIFHYDGITKVYSGWSVAELDPLESKLAGKDVFATEAPHSTLSPVSDFSEDQAGVFDEGSGEWVIIPDHRGATIYSTHNTEATAVEVVGDIPAGYTKEQPGPYDEWDGDQWITDVARELFDRKSKILSEIGVAVRNKIIGGFESSALGDLHRYSSEEEDQANIQGNVIAAMLNREVVHFCYSMSGVRFAAEHTSEQMIQVGDDLKSHILGWQYAGASERDRLETIADVESVIAFGVKLQVSNV